MLWKCLTTEIIATFIIIVIFTLQICVPKVGTFEGHTLTAYDCMCHVLIEVDDHQYKTASDKVSITLNKCNAK